MRNKNKAEVVSKYNEIYEEAKQFEEDENDPQAINAVYTVWFGFKLHSQKHKYMKDFDIDKRIHPRIFQLTHTGEPIPSCEYMYKITENTRTIATFMSDDIVTLNNEPK